jgi:hypothetical protein
MVLYVSAHARRRHKVGRASEWSGPSTRTRTFLSKPYEACVTQRISGVVAAALAIRNLKLAKGLIQKDAQFLRAPRTDSRDIFEQTSDGSPDIVAHAIVVLIWTWCYVSDPCLPGVKSNSEIHSRTRRRHASSQCKAGSPQRPDLYLVIIMGAILLRNSNDQPLTLPFTSPSTQLYDEICLETTCVCCCEPPHDLVLHLGSLSRCSQHGPDGMEGHFASSCSLW